jgi:hypothetical protein
MVAALVCEVALRVVVTYPFFVNTLHLLPTPGLMEMKVSHSSDSIEHCFYIILSRLIWFDTFFLDAKRLVDAHSVIGVKNACAGYL